MSFSVVVVQYLVPCAIVTVCYLSICRLPNPPPMASNCSRRRQGLYNLKHTSHYKVFDKKVPENVCLPVDTQIMIIVGSILKKTQGCRKVWKSGEMGGENLVLGENNVSPGCDGVNLSTKPRVAMGVKGVYCSMWIGSGPR